MSTESRVAQIVKQIKPAIVAIGVPGEGPDGRTVLNISGTGFNIHPKGLVVTCQHVFEPYVGASAIQELKAAEGQIRRLEVIKPVAYFFREIQPGQWGAIQKEVAHVQGSQGDDIALIDFPQGDFVPGKISDYPYLQLDADVQHEGEEIGIAGFPLGETLHDLLGSATLSFHFGNIGGVLPFYSIKVKPKRYQLDVFTNPGNSGGPVFRLADGHVVGMLQGGMVSGAQPTGISYGAPAWQIQDNIAAWNEGKDTMRQLDEANESRK